MIPYRSSLGTTCYINFNKLTHERDNRWFDDGYNKYDRKYYRFSGYDLGR
jgi:hypothetical protein